MWAGITDNMHNINPFWQQNECEILFTVETDTEWQFWSHIIFETHIIQRLLCKPFKLQIMEVSDDISKFFFFLYWSKYRNSSTESSLSGTRTYKREFYMTGHFIWKFIKIVANFIQNELKCNVLFDIWKLIS